MKNPETDGLLALRLREIAGLQTDSKLADGGTLSGEEKARILHIVADVFEDYIIEAKAAKP